MGPHRSGRFSGTNTIVSPLYGIEEMGRAKFLTEIFGWE